MSRTSFFLLVVVVFQQYVSSVKVDLGECSCNCGQTQSTSIATRFFGPMKGGKFYESIRGLKGDQGTAGQVGMEGVPGEPGEEGPKGPPAAYDKKTAGGLASASCSDVLSAGIATSGIYSIKPSGPFGEMQVYCEMLTAGGGWTLVASVHENNIYGKCSLGDMWSSDQGTNRSVITKAASTWESFETFGYPEAATSGDYKSPAYFNLAASDVMIWQVPNDSGMDQWFSSATMQFYTDNQFLSSYGGTLQSLYSKYFPMKKGQGRGGSSGVIHNIFDTFESSTEEMRRLIPGFFTYTYDDPNNRQITDGSSDMYDGGNMVEYKIGDNPYKQITYGQDYLDFESSVQIYSRKTHPFLMLMWIGNSDRSTEEFGIRVRSGTGADSSGSRSTETGNLSRGNLTCSYRAYSVYGANDPSICEVYFYCTNQQAWRSVLPSEFTTTEWSSGTDSLSNGVAVRGSPQSILMGYTLLSRTSGNRVVDSYIQAALNRMLQDFETIQVFPALDCGRLNESLSVPVQYARGSNDETLSKVPPSLRRRVTPGYVQFRVVDPEGVPTALCPGVKSEVCVPQHICIGSIGATNNSTVQEKRSCGDFAGWAGNPTDNASDVAPDGSAKSWDDIRSTILIFTR